MCGLAGQICFGEERTNPLLLRNMLVAQEIRGKDASGAAYLKDGEILTIKKAITPRTFADVELTKKLWLDMANSPILLMHARHATQGPAKDNENNHPVVAADWVVTHNGHVSNDDDLIAYYGMTEERPAEVDTVAINMLLAQEESAEAALQHLSLLGGTATFLAWNITRPDEVVMARVNGPALYLSLNREHRILHWSSDPDGLHWTKRPGFGKLPFIDMTVLPQNSAFIVRPFTGEVKQYDLFPFTFRMPKVKKKVVSNSSKKDTLGPLGNTNFPPGTVNIQGTGTSNQPTGSICSSQTQMGFVSRSIENVATLLHKWFVQQNGPGGDPVLILTKKMSVSVGENYTQLHKPAPQFEAEMAGMVHLPLTGGEIKTPYGTWFLTPHHRWFRGAKRVKKYWDERVGPTVKQIINLPASTALQMALRDYYTLEAVKIYHKPESENQFINGLMCPLCGIISMPRVWREWNYTCAWCFVKSRGRAEVADNAIY